MCGVLNALGLGVRLELNYARQGSTPEQSGVQGQRQPREGGYVRLPADAGSHRLSSWEDLTLETCEDDLKDISLWKSITYVFTCVLLSCCQRLWVGNCFLHFSSLAAPTAVSSQGLSLWRLCSPHRIVPASIDQLSVSTQ